MTDNRFLLGMGLLNSNQPSLQPTSPFNGIMNSLAMGQQARSNLTKQQMEQERFELDKKYKEAQIAGMSAPKDKGTKLIGNELIDLNTMTPVYTGKETPQATPAAIQQYQFAVGQGFKGNFEDWQIKMANAKASKTDINLPAIQSAMDEPLKVSELEKFADANGNMPSTIMTPRQLKEEGFILSKKPTEKDMTASYVADSLTTASQAVEDVLSRPEFNPSSFEEFAKSTTNWTASPEYQQYKSSADEWATNLVFLRSGATAREEEKSAAFNNYWPQPGDKEETRSFKTKFRKMQEINAYSMAAMGGRVSKEKAEASIARLEKEIDDMSKSTNGAPEGIDADVWDAMTDEEKALF